MAKPDAATQGLKVLVVDDDADLRESLADLLRAWGHEVHVASSARQAMAREGQYDVAFIDLRMPGTTGYTLARQLRAGSMHEASILVAHTGTTGDAVEARSRKAGFDAFLRKPASVDDLRKALRRGSFIRILRTQ